MNAVAPANAVKTLIDKHQQKILQALPKNAGLSPMRLASIVLTEMRLTPKLQECEPLSIFGALVQAAQLGLTPGSALGQCYLIPYKRECQFQLGYRGMIYLATHSGGLSSIEATPVFKGDDFSISLGTDQYIRHIPSLDANSDDEKNLVGVYGIAKLKGESTPRLTFMSKAQIDRIRKRSKAGSSGPWVTDYVEMARKTVVRNMFKYLPVSLEAQTAATLDEAADRGEQSRFIDSEFLDITEGTPEPEKNEGSTAYDKFRNEFTAKQAAQEPSNA